MCCHSFTETRPCSYLQQITGRKIIPARAYLCFVSVFESQVSWISLHTILCLLRWSIGTDWPHRKARLGRATMGATREDTFNVLWKGKANPLYQSLYQTGMASPYWPGMTDCFYCARSRPIFCLWPRKVLACARRRVWMCKHEICTRFAVCIYEWFSLMLAAQDTAVLVPCYCVSNYLFTQ